MGSPVSKVIRCESDRSGDERPEPGRCAAVTALPPLTGSLADVLESEAVVSQTARGVPEQLRGPRLLPPSSAASHPHLPLLVRGRTYAWRAADRHKSQLA
jgi:hypothetical protein